MFFCYDAISRTGFRLSLHRVLPSRACVCFAEILWFGWKVFWRDEDGLGGLGGLVVTPVGLEEDGVDLFEVDGFGAVSDGFDHAADAEVFDGSEGSF